MDYHQSDFTEDNYKKLLEKALKRYEFISYPEVKSYSKNKEFIVWRHDVDFSVHRALSLAKIEANLDIKATYFVQLSSTMYNVFEQEIKELLFQIKELGHDINLHFDSSQYPISNKQILEEALIFEKQILEKLFHTKITSFSFHNPNEEILNFNEFQYTDMINTYAQYFKDVVDYCSDSNGYWRHQRLFDFLSNEKKSNKQVLTHPEWWQKKAISPYERIKRCVQGRLDNNLTTYNNNLLKDGRKNIR